MTAGMSEAGGETARRLNTAPTTGRDAPVTTDEDGGEPLELSSQDTVAVNGTEMEAARAEVADVQDGGYGWVCVVCVFLINAHTWGVNSVRNIFHVGAIHMHWFWS